MNCYGILQSSKTGRICEEGYIVAEHIKNLLQYAKTQPKRDYRVFSRLKNRLNDLGLSPEEYQEAVKQLARVLEV